MPQSAAPPGAATGAAPPVLSYATPAQPPPAPAPSVAPEFDPGPFLKIGGQFSVKGSPWFGPALASPKAFYLLKVAQNVQAHGGGLVGALVSAALTKTDDTRTCDVSQVPPPVRAALDPKGKRSRCDVIILRKEAVSLAKIGTINTLLRLWSGGDRFGITTGLFRNGKIRRFLTDNGWTINAELVPTAAPTHGSASGTGSKGPGVLARIGLVLLAILVFIIFIALRVGCEQHGRGY